MIVDLLVAEAFHFDPTPGMGMLYLKAILFLVFGGILKAIFGRKIEDKKPGSNPLSRTPVPDVPSRKPDHPQPPAGMALKRISSFEPDPSTRAVPASANLRKTPVEAAGGLNLEGSLAANHPVVVDERSETYTGAQSDPTRGSKDASSGVVERLQTLGTLYAKGLITADLYEAKRQEILQAL